MQLNFVWMKSAQTGIAVIAALSSLGFSQIAQANSVQEVIDDMKLNHEGQPHGVETWWSWGTKGRVGIGNNPASDAWYATWWNQLYEPTTLNPSNNGRVEQRNAQLWALYDDGKWYHIWSADRYGGWAWTENYATPIGSPDWYDSGRGRASRAGCKSSSGCGTMLHGHFDYISWFDRNRIRGWFGTCEARLINDSNARYLLGVGADYKNQNYHNYYDIAIGRLKWVTSDWRSFSFHTISEQQVRDNPPPLIGGRVNIVNSWSNGPVHIEWGDHQTANVGGNNAWHSSHWTFEPVGDGYFRIRNRWQNTFLHIEWGDHTWVNCSNGDPNWHSAHWSLESVGGGRFKIKNRWKQTYLHNEWNQGQLRCTAVGDNGNWSSARWRFSAAP
jgi:hypothetical protein